MWKSTGWREMEIESTISQKYNYERAKFEDPNIIQEYFDRVQEVIAEHGILQEDIYNFDETGFAMGLCAAAKVITGSDRYARPNLLPPCNREWATAIEAVDSIGWILPSYTIFKAKKYTRLGWFEDVPDDWRINISDNRWTTDNIGLEWLKTHFIPLTDGRILGKYRMLIFDGYGSHLTAEFDLTCTENNIIPVCMPPHSSHLLQPLDVGCFAVLKRHYEQLVEQRMRLGFNHNDKIDFLTAFPTTRTMAYKAQTVWNSFAATGLTPQITRQFTPQLTTVIRRIDQLTGSPNEVIDQAIMRMSKPYEKTVNDLLIVWKENKDLRAAHEKEKQKRQISHEQLRHSYKVRF
ncbi:conserved hypothetical protein [Talaromyces stipitatus ATCC 10500]|uniref:DDE-1 domain-containing protein n=1 Tax=Talaromyces stipitatus (strain ATCC 10500 / CBS 375.48 / QM 6759 / NRRL 1006) TaxID=441959 RepID=B8MGC3_TALSN|nr:uncharacterized protein TSTA_013460 [Talaromyces stipitatus ATCC 10500]EED16243.1 conserved hypothetical protein [Talaromyces stipitatus ATCC 10500]